MTPSLDVQLLQRLHHLLRQKADLSERMAKGPKIVQTAEINVRNFVNKAEEIRQAIKETKIKADGKQLQLGEREAHIEKMSGQRNACESNREFQLLTDQIAADQQANGVLQDEILELLEKIDTLEALLQKTNTDLETLKKETEKLRSQTDERMAVVRRDFEKVESELAEAEKQLPSDVRGKFKRMMDAVGEDALSKVEDKTCGHCSKIISVQTYSELTMSRVVFCGGCGSLMYLPRATAVN